MKFFDSVAYFTRCCRSLLAGICDIVNRFQKLIQIIEKLVSRFGPLCSQF